mgnify:CR=1 FL=1
MQEPYAIKNHLARLPKKFVIFIGVNVKKQTVIITNNNKTDIIAINQLIT